MRGFFRLATIGVLLACFGGFAQAQSGLRHMPNGQNQFDALYEGDSGVARDTSGPSGLVPPSESHTVMGLRVPR